MPGNNHALQVCITLGLRCIIIHKHFHVLINLKLALIILKLNNVRHMLPRHKLQRNGLIVKISNLIANWLKLNLFVGKANIGLKSGISLLIQISGKKLVITHLEVIIKKTIPMVQMTKYGTKNSFSWITVIFLLPQVTLNTGLLPLRSFLLLQVKSQLHLLIVPQHMIPEWIVRMDYK